MSTTIDKLESELAQADSSAEHCQRLVNALGNPSEWEYTGDVSEAPHCEANCACGHPIRWCFHIHHPDGRQNIVGSTCINHFASINPSLAEHLGKARDALVERLRTAAQAARRAIADEANQVLWVEYSELRDRAKAIHQANRDRGRHSPRSLWLFVEGWKEKYRASNPPEYQRAGDLKRWLNTAIERVKDALGAIENKAPVNQPTPSANGHSEPANGHSDEGFNVSTLTVEPTTPSPIPFLGTHNCTVTVVSPKSREHRTFAIKTIQHGGLEGKRIIALLSGPDNEEDYTGFGFVRDDGTIATWRKFQGTQYERYADLFDRPTYWMNRGVQYMPESRCRRCNRKLTHPSSLMSGLGPECITKV